MAMISKLHIETALRNGKTFLKNSFCTQPFKIADVTEDKSSAVLQLMLMSSSPGILDGDEYHLQIDVAENCSLNLQTQSYQRLFQMNKGASQFLNVNMQQGSSFTYLPHPLVPHRNAVFHSKNKINMAEGCTLVWGEVMSCGRKLNGEIFKFSCYHSVTEIFKNGKLVVKENLLIKPGEINVTSIGQLEGYSHQATLIYINDEANIDEAIKILVQDLNAHIDIAFGVSALPVNGLIIRMLGNKAEQLFDVIKSAAEYLDASTNKVIVEPQAYV